MDSLKSLLVAVSEVRAQAAHMCDVAQDLAYGAVYGRYVTDYDMPIALADEALGYDFREIYMPGHPNADERGYVRSFEVVTANDVPSDTQRAYEACLETAGMAPADDAIALDADVDSPSNMFASDDDEALEPLAQTA